MEARRKAAVHLTVMARLKAAAHLTVMAHLTVDPRTKEVAVHPMVEARPMEEAQNTMTTAIRFSQLDQNLATARVQVRSTFGVTNLLKLTCLSSHLGLRSIAQGSADQASSAVANQELAAKQASYIAQNNLANLALQASATAMAALQGKQVLLSKIEQENLDAHQALETELQQLRQAKRSAKAAQQVIFESLLYYHRHYRHYL